MVKAIYLWKFHWYQYQCCKLKLRLARPWSKKEKRSSKLHLWEKKTKWNFKDLCYPAPYNKSLPSTSWMNWRILSNKAWHSSFQNWRSRSLPLIWLLSCNKCTFLKLNILRTCNFFCCIIFPSTWGPLMSEMHYHSCNITPLNSHIQM